MFGTSLNQARNQGSAGGAKPLLEKISPPCKNVLDTV